MFLFIFENIGTSELLLVGIVALIFLGPRKLPEMARKMGKMMADFRATTNEFKSTWEREVNFEEEVRAVRTGELSSGPPTIARENSILAPAPAAADITTPEIRSIDREAFEKLAPQATGESRETAGDTSVEDAGASTTGDLSDKRTWL